SSSIVRSDGCLPPLLVATPHRSSIHLSGLRSDARQSCAWGDVPVVLRTDTPRTIVLPSVRPDTPHPARRAGCLPLVPLARVSPEQRRPSSAPPCFRP